MGFAATEHQSQLVALCHGHSAHLLANEMPTLLLQDGFKFFFYANDHEPRHIHVSKADDYAKIELSSFRIASNFMKPKDLKTALRIIQQNNELFEEKWDDWFRQR